MTSTPYRPSRQPEERYLLGSEVAEILQVHPKTVARWAKEGRLPHMRTFGGHRRYSEQEIRDLAASLTEQPREGE